MGAAQGLGAPHPGEDRPGGDTSSPATPTKLFKDDVSLREAGQRSQSQVWSRSQAREPGPAAWWPWNRCLDTWKVYGRDDQLIPFLKVKTTL